MKVADPQLTAVPSFGSTKMEERKRPALADRDDTAPPAKRQAISVNGKPHPDTDMPWKDDLESFQKDAILRQMREYKREKNTLETRVTNLEEQRRYHDDHLRVVDSWFSQLLDEMKVIASDGAADHTFNANATAFPTSLLFDENEQFQEHLAAHSQSIKTTISDLFRKIPAANPDARRLQEELTRLLAKEKGHLAELQSVTAEKDQLSEFLENASYRYMVAEKKLERVKSLQVAKLEKGAIQSGSMAEESSSTKKDSSADVNGAEGGTGVEASDAARKEALAAAAKRKDQVEQLEAENFKLTEEVTSLKTNLTGLSDDDYAKTELFKNLKSQHEDLIKRINHLEATNIQLREETRKFTEERTSYRIQMDDESRTVTRDVEGQLAKAETDLARIRNSRDELLSDLAIKKASQDDRRHSVEQLKELADAREHRIAALETEVERLRIQVGEARARGSSEAVSAMSEAEVRAKVASLEKEYALLSNELPSMEAAWKKAQALASKKIVDAAALEDQVSRLTAEKAKADQKYFGAMKAKETREAEIRALRAQNAKSSEIVQQLKDTDSSSRNLAVNLEKQLAEFREAVTNVSNQQRVSQQKINEHAATAQAMTTQIAELKKSLGAKDTRVGEVSRLQRQAEVELEELKVRLAETKKSLEVWKKKGLGGQSEEFEGLRTLAICTVCRKNFKNTAIKTCGHVFCKECVDERLSARSRKCPNCGRSFGANDHMHVTL